VAVLTFASGVVVAVRMTETRKRPSYAAPPPCVEPTELARIPNAVVVDVRSAEEFAAGHIDGALHIPLDSLAKRASEIPKDAVVITACGKGGGRADRAARELQALGHGSARPLCGGTVAWFAATNRRA
jgi:rhodanese-related sulfurtransferase